ncbi:acyltransferase family protein [Paraburkholderia sp. BR10954]|uniref:acyltransferase family protein n=1 Tax=Paraburkholderia sp. BR10954 TaxID=3236995 RepID=UPI0034D2EBE0
MIFNRSMPANQHIGSLDGLRTLAVACVVLTHYAGGDSVFRRMGIDWAVTGVHIFFALSGFLITKLLVEKYFVAQSFWRGITAFWIARVFRILPLAYIALSVVALCSVSPLPREFYLYNLTFTSNIFTAKTGDWLPHTGHFWSLAVEMQFYVLYPVLVWLFRPRLLLSLSVLIAALFILQHFPIAPATYVAPMFLLPARADAFLWGALVFAISNLRSFAGIVRSGMIVAAVCYYGQTLGAHFLGWPVLLPEMSIGNIVFASLVGLALLPGTLTQRILSNKVLVHFGTISYGIYVWHPIMWLMRSWINDVAHGILYIDHVPIVLVLVAMTIGFSEISWLLFEKRVNGFGQKLAKRALATDERLTPSYAEVKVKF